ncbi:MAG: ThiF family adenylyltransferase [Nanoarchaeota archaeon]
MEQNKKLDEERYSRQLLLPEIGKEGQEKIAQATVAVVGIGALGTVAAELLARAGIGKLLLVDRDIVEESNLQRQVLFTEDDLGRSKAIVGKERLTRINSAITLEAYPIHLNRKNIVLLDKATIILDCTDNLQSRFLLNDYSQQQKIPWIYAAAIKTNGYVFPIIPSLPEGACLRCFLTSESSSGETCDTVGVLNTVTAAVASLQVTLALKIILEEIKMIKMKLYSLNVWKPELKVLTVKQNLDCPACWGKYEYLDGLKGEEEIRTVQFCSTGRYQIVGRPQELKEIQRRWEKIDEVKRDDGLLQFKNIILFADGRALIKARSEQEALVAYAKWVGD